MSIDTQSTLQPQTAWGPEPSFMGHIGSVEVDHGSLRYWDSGPDTGPETVVFLHAMTGDGESWSYQHQFFSPAGYRTISFSRRGYFGSSTVDEDEPGTAAQDLLALLDRLGLGRVHLVGTAGGGFIAFEFAVAYPERLQTLTVASSIGGIHDSGFEQITAALLPESWPFLPHDFREVGPSYRAANHSGLARWNEIAGRNITQTPKQPRHIAVTLADIASLRPPVLLMTGSADLYMPPSRVRSLAGLIDQCTVSIIPEAGHAAYWEQPEAFNASLLQFLLSALGRSFSNPDVAHGESA